MTLSDEDYKDRINLLQDEIDYHLARDIPFGQVAHNIEHCSTLIREYCRLAKQEEPPKIDTSVLLAIQAGLYGLAAHLPPRNVLSQSRLLLALDIMTIDGLMG